MNISNPTSITDPRALLKTLHNDFPVFREYQPLAIGIDKQLKAKLPDLDRKALRIALSMHTHATKYLKAVSKGTARFDLEGNSAEALSEAHRKHASEMLQERSKKDAERRKAQQEIEARAAVERQHSEKLEQLAAKFAPK
jgi:ProP effector